jgi:hypothetical protein
MLNHAYGNGHQDLADKLNITKSKSLAVSGSCNSRIIRTTLKDSYAAQEKTLYIVGLTFVGRTELPINRAGNTFEGHWISFQNGPNPTHQYKDIWTDRDIEQFIKLKLKSEIDSIDDRVDDLVYRIASMVGDLRSRGHQIVVFRQTEQEYSRCLDDPKFTFLDSCVNIIDRLRWTAIDYQLAHGVQFEPGDSNLAPNIRHACPGEHGPLNDFLVEYIKQHALHLPIL